jgi:23S rRNA (adenine2503-C2)-methyltransferase
MQHTIPNIKDLARSELKEAMTALGEPAYRASQLHQWLYSHRPVTFDDITILSLALRKKLSGLYAIRSAVLDSTMQETCSGEELPTTKFLVRMPDEEAVESVIIPAENRITACISSQAGCALKCAFCATGRLGLKRNLTTGEITDQVHLLNDYLAARCGNSGTITNIVFMGMGEPLLNTPNVLDAIETLGNQSYRFSLSQRKITISTVGIVPGIAVLADSSCKAKLAVSLHSAMQKKREAMMPVAREWTLPLLKKSIAAYNRKTGRPVTLVYMLLEGVNDAREDARALAEFAKGLFCKINLIDYNAIVNIKFKPVYTGKRDLFLRSLLDSGLQVTVRKSHGASINAACGQLAADRKQPIPEEPH